MPIHLSNRNAKATILPGRGGLLQSLVLTDMRGNSREILYMPENFSEAESGWPGGGAPIMFPFAGRTFHQDRPFNYELGGQVYNMPLHGFSWAKPWSAVKQDAKSVTLLQEDGPGTRELFPFSWRQEATYSLEADRILIDYRVTNLGSLAAAFAPMPVAVGIHPYFKLDAGGGDRSLQCDANEALQVTPSGAAGKRSPHTTDCKEFNLSDPIYRNLILTGLTKRQAGFKAKESGEVAMITWSKDSPIQYVVLWRKDDEPFHCIEPWMGLPDAVSNGNGLKTLSKGETLAMHFEISAGE
jgi:galactose mutarotase-like enzyme